LHFPVGGTREGKKLKGILRPEVRATTQKISHVDTFNLTSTSEYLSIFSFINRPVFGKILAGPEKFSSGKERKTQLKIAKNPPLRPK
jgi:hypothetical protein